MNRLFPLLLLVLLMVACKNKSVKEDSKPVYSKETLDTILSPSIPIVSKPELFEKAFIKGIAEGKTIVNESISNAIEGDSVIIK